MPNRDGTGPAGRGAGRGYGGPKNCKCPECGLKKPHTRGQPCARMKCPKCGVNMVRGDL